MDTLDKLIYKATQAAFIEYEGDTYRVNYICNEEEESYISFNNEDGMQEDIQVNFEDLPIDTVFYKLTQVEN